jgi:hypothetical protein
MGYRLLLCLKNLLFWLKTEFFLNREGIPTNYHLMPANKHDSLCLENMLIKNQFSNLVLVGDVGYLSDFNKAWFKECWILPSLLPIAPIKTRKTPKEKRSFLKRERSLKR